jgi:hypothetical protein
MRVKVTRHNGVLKVDIDGNLYAPLSFKSFRPNPVNVSEFYKAGVRLFSVLSSGVTSALGVPYSLYGESWVGDGKYDFDPVDRQMDMFIDNAPEAYFAPMIQLDTREWYIESHNVPNSFTHLSQIAHDKEWRVAASEYLKEHNIDPRTAGETGETCVHCGKKIWDPDKYGFFIPGMPADYENSGYCLGTCGITFG